MVLDFPGSPVVKTSHFHCGGTGSILGPLVREVPHAVRCGQKQTKKDNGIDISIMVDWDASFVSPPLINNQLNIHNSTEKLCPTHSGCQKIHISIYLKVGGLEHRTRTTAQVMPTLPAPSHSGWACSPREPGSNRRDGHMPWGSQLPWCSQTQVSRYQWHRSLWPLPSSHRGIHNAGPPPTTHSSGSHQPNSTTNGSGTLMSAPALPLSSREWHSEDHSCSGSACFLCAPGGEARDTGSSERHSSAQEHSGLRLWHGAESQPEAVQV